MHKQRIIQAELEQCRQMITGVVAQRQDEVNQLILLQQSLNSPFMTTFIPSQRVLVQSQYLARVSLLQQRQQHMANQLMQLEHRSAALVAEQVSEQRHLELLESARARERSQQPVLPDEGAKPDTAVRETVRNGEVDRSVENQLPQQVSGVKRLQAVKQELQSVPDQHVGASNGNPQDTKKPPIPITIKFATERSAANTASLIVKKEDPASEVSKLRASLKAVKEELGRELALDTKGREATNTVVASTEDSLRDNSREGVAVKAPWRGLVKEEPGQDGKLKKGKEPDRVRAAVAALALRPRRSKSASRQSGSPIRRSPRRSRSVSRRTPRERRREERESRLKAVTRRSSKGEGACSPSPQRRRMGSYVSAAYGVADLKYMDACSDEDGKPRPTDGRKPPPRNALKNF
jgi:hypothetical protein